MLFADEDEYTVVVYAAAVERLSGHPIAEAVAAFADDRHPEESKAAAAEFENVPGVPAFGFGLRPEIAALTMSGSSIIVAVNAVLLKRLRLPAPASSE